MTITYIGFADGMHTWEVRDESGALIGMNYSLTPPCPGEGYVFDEATGVWIQQGS